MKKKNKKARYRNGFFTILLVVNCLLIGVNYSFSKGNSDGGITKTIHAMFTEEKKDIHHVKLKPIVTNLKPNSANRNNYISVSFAVSVKGKKAADKFKVDSAEARDSIITFLNEQTIADLLMRDEEKTDDETNEWGYLKREIKEKLDELYIDTDSPIEEVLITDLMLQ